MGIEYIRKDLIPYHIHEFEVRNHNDVWTESEVIAFKQEIDRVPVQTREEICVGYVPNNAYGYDTKELLAFALLCREHDISEEDLHDFCLNVEAGYKAGLTDLHKAVAKSMEGWFDELEK